MCAEIIVPLLAYRMFLVILTLIPSMDADVHLKKKAKKDHEVDSSPGLCFC